MLLLYRLVLGLVEGHREPTLVFSLKRKNIPYNLSFSLLLPSKQSESICMQLLGSSNTLNISEEGSHLEHALWSLWPLCSFLQFPVPTHTQHPCPSHCTSRVSHDRGPWTAFPVFSLSRVFSTQRSHPSENTFNCVAPVFNKLTIVQSKGPKSYLKLFSRPFTTWPHHAMPVWWPNTCFHVSHPLAPHCSLVIMSLFCIWPIHSFFKASLIPLEPRWSLCFIMSPWGLVLPLS